MKNFIFDIAMMIAFIIVAFYAVYWQDEYYISTNKIKIMHTCLLYSNNLEDYRSCLIKHELGDT